MNNDMELVIENFSEQEDVYMDSSLMTNKLLMTYYNRF